MQVPRVCAIFFLMSRKRKRDQSTISSRSNRNVQRTGGIDGEKVIAWINRLCIIPALGLAVLSLLCVPGDSEGFGRLGVIIYNLVFIAFQVLFVILPCYVFCREPRSELFRRNMRMSQWLLFASLLQIGVVLIVWCT